jgi:exonuclease III
MDLKDIYRIFHPTTAQYTFFTAAHENFSKIDHFLGHKASLNKCKKTEITEIISLQCNKMNSTTKAAAETTGS